MIRTIIFDLDDTLIETGPLYEEAIKDASRIISDNLSEPPAMEEIIRLQEEIDTEAVMGMGFETDRFPWSLAETYRVLVSREGTGPEAAIERDLEEIGLSVYSTVPPLSPGAADLLRSLKGGYELILYTVGVREIQREKIDVNGIAKWFDEIHIVDMKDEKTLRGIIDGRRPEETLIVGDSLRGEIAPALALGLRAVYLEREKAWSYHNVEVEGEYERIRSIGELAGLLAGQ